HLSSLRLPISQIRRRSTSRASAAGGRQPLPQRYALPVTLEMFGLLTPPQTTSVAPAAAACSRACSLALAIPSALKPCWPPNTELPETSFTKAQLATFAGVASAMPSALFTAAVQPDTRIIAAVSASSFMDMSLPEVGRSL